MPSFDPSHTDDLKAWLIKELEPICDADPEVLSDYVLALLKHDASESDQQAMLSEQLEDFLADQTSPFVTKTLAALRTQDYLPKAKRTANTAQEEEAADGASSSRKRGADDEGRRSPAKAARDTEGRGAAGPARGPDDRTQGAPRRDQQRQKPLCRDFHQRGFCARGDSCKFDHSLPSRPGGASAASSPNPPMMGMPMGQPNFAQPPRGPANAFSGMGQQFGMPQMGASGWSGSQGYPQHMSPGPGNGQILNGDGPDLAARLGGQMAPQPDVADMSAGPSFAEGSQRGGRGGARGARGGGRGTFERRATSNTTLVIENVPQEHLDLIQVNEYFKKFGTITNIQIDAPNKKALVSFSQPAEAKTAHASPEVIFNNRFVKVYFQKLDEPAAAPRPNAAPAPRPAPAQTLKSNFVPGQNKFVRPELAQEKAKEVQAAAEAAQKKLDGLMAEQKELMVKLTGGTASAEEKKTLMGRFPTLETDIKKATEEVRSAVSAAKEGKAPSAPSSQPADPAAWREQREKKEREQLDRELDAHSKGGETPEELRAKLAKLEAEAGELGINTAEVMSGRGGFRGGRGGRVFRGATRGGYNTYFRGGARGGAAVANRASMRLDNRTSKVHVTDVPTGAADKAKDFFKQFGDVDAITEREDGSFVVEYKARASGERALRSGLSVPDVGPVKATWNTEGGASVSSVPGTAVESGADGSASLAEGHLDTGGYADGEADVKAGGEDEDADRDDHFRRGGS